MFGHSGSSQFSVAHNKSRSSGLCCSHKRCSRALHAAHMKLVVRVSGFFGRTEETYEASGVRRNGVSTAFTAPAFFGDGDSQMYSGQRHPLLLQYFAAAEGTSSISGFELQVVCAQRRRSFEPNSSMRPSRSRFLEVSEPATRYSALRITFCFESGRAFFQPLLLSRRPTLPSRGGARERVRAASRRARLP